MDTEAMHGTHRQTVSDGQSPIEALVVALNDRGISARAMHGETLLARNTAGDPPAGDPRGGVLSPGLRQEVACRRRADGSAWWFWVWSGSTRDAAPDLEPLCRVDDIDTAAARIAHVLAVPFAEGAQA